MTDTYTAWDGNSYSWPPPEGWYKAPDGRFWAPGTGPSGGELHAATPNGQHTGFESILAGGDQRVLSPTSASSGLLTNMDDHSSTPANGGIDLSGIGILGPGGGTNGHDPQTLGGQAVTNQSSPFGAVFDPGGSLVDPSESPRSDAHTPAAQFSGSLTLDHGYRRVESWAGQSSGRGENIGRVVAVAMTLLLALAVVIVGGIAMTTDFFQGGTPTTVLVAPGEVDGTGNAPLETDPQDNQNVQLQNATDQESAASPNRDQVTQFRQLLNDNGLTSGNLLPYELTNFGTAFCRYAEASNNPTEFDSFRSQAIEQTATELNPTELHLVIDATLVTFCPDQADRLGISVKPLPPAGEG